MAWAFATAGQKDDPLIAALAEAAKRRFSSFTGQDISNMAWAFAKVGHWDVPLFAAMARATESKVDVFNA